MNMMIKDKATVGFKLQFATAVAAAISRFLECLKPHWDRNYNRISSICPRFLIILKFSKSLGLKPQFKNKIVACVYIPGPARPTEEVAEGLA